LKTSDGKEFKPGMRLLISGYQDTATFCDHAGTVMEVRGTDRVLVRIDDWTLGHGNMNAHWVFREDHKGRWNITEKIEEPSKPRFMTAWMVDSETDAFRPTGDAFKSLEAAEKFCTDLLKKNDQTDQLAVFELRSVHLARLQVTSEAA
jgi:hypothetical protein